MFSQILKELNGNGIDVIVLKGAYLAENVYGDIGARDFSDIDILIKENEKKTFKKIISNILKDKDKKWISLDIHYHLEPFLKVDMESIWSRAIPITISGQKTFSLSPEDNLLHLCVHGAFHHLFQDVGLRILCDISETINRFGNEIDWDDFYSRSIEWGMEDCVYICLKLANKFLGARVDPGIIEKIPSKDFDKMLLKWAQKQIFDSKMGFREDRNISSYFWGLWTGGSLKDRIRAWKNFLFPPEEVLSDKLDTLNEAKSQLYLSRFRRNFINHIKAFWLILARDRDMMEKVKKHNEFYAIRRKIVKSQRLKDNMI